MRSTRPASLPSLRPLLLAWGMGCLSSGPLARPVSNISWWLWKPIAVICHAPWLLISAGLTKGRKMTSYMTIQDDLKNSGANWVDEASVLDGNWVSSRQPADIPEFNRVMIKLFAEEKQKGRRAA